MQKQLIAEEETPWNRVATWFENNWPDVTQGAIAVGFVLAQLGVGLAPSSHAKAAYVIAVLIVIVLGVSQVALILANHRRGERMSDLRKENISLNQTLTATNQQLNAIGSVRPLQVRPLIFAYLKQLGEHELRFGEKLGESERLTLYLHDDEKQVFIPTGRFSNSAEFCKLNRAEYPDDQGCLALAWKNGFHFKYDYPSPTDLSAYLLRCIKDNMPTDTTSKIRMKSVLYCGGVIWNKNRDKQVGVLMLEATKDRYNVNETAPFMKKQEQGYLGELIHALLSGQATNNSPATH